MEEQIKANAELVVQQGRQLSGPDFGYTQESVEWLEGFIERMRTSGEFDDPETKQKLTGVFGSYLGECVIRCYGGRWMQPEDGEWWCVAFDEKNQVFPFAKVAKQIDYGLEDSIAGFFRIIPVVFKNLPGSELATAKKPWWKVW